MPRVTKRGTTPETQPDVLEVVHHEIPDSAAGAGAAPIPAPRTETISVTSATPSAATNATSATTGAAENDMTAPMGTGMTWRSMLRAVAITETAAFLVLLVAGTLYGLEFFAPLAIAAVLFGAAALWLPKMSKAAVVYSLVVTSLTLLMFGGMFFGWTGFLYPTSWFEMAFATCTVLLPIGGITAAIATLRGKNGTDAAKTPSRIVGGLAAAIVVIGLVGTATAGSATRLPGDVSLTASNFEFEQTALTAKAGDVPIYFQNDDPFVHNVGIKGMSTSSDAAGGKAVRHVFKGLKAGTYTYICTIHPDMKGTLTVT